MTTKTKSDEPYRGRRYRIPCYCRKCHLLRIVTPLYKTTPDERLRIQRNYVCSDCE